MSCALESKGNSLLNKVVFVCIATLPVNCTTHNVEYLNWVFYIQGETDVGFLEQE